MFYIGVKRLLPGIPVLYCTSTYVCLSLFCSDLSIFRIVQEITVQKHKLPYRTGDLRYFYRSSNSSEISLHVIIQCDNLFLSSFFKKISNKDY